MLGARTRSNKHVFTSSNIVYTEEGSDPKLDPKWVR